MNPDFFQKLAELTAKLRGGLVFNPLDEIQKRASQYGEGIGEQLQAQNAQAGYAKAHPQSQRAQQEMFTNGMKNALQLTTGERPALVPAIKTLEGKIVDGITHAHAYGEAGITEPLPAKNEGYADAATGKFYTRQAAEKLMDRFMSKSVKAQVAERSRQAGKSMGITTEDLNGKLYANRGTRADPPIDADEFDRIVAEAKKRKGGTALDSAVSKLPVSLQGKTFKNDVDKRIRDALWEKTLRNEKAVQEAESNAAEAANAKDYGLDKDGRAALARGNKQRRTGIAQDSVASIGLRLHDALTKNGGFTIDPQTGADLTSGYSVGGGEKSGVLLKKPLADLQPNELDAFLATNKSKLAPGQAWGGWVDNGHVYVEPADQVADLNAAQRLGNERGEKAIWDHANKVEIPLKAGKAEAALAAQNEYNDILNKWSRVWAQREGIKQELLSAHTEALDKLIHAIKNPDYGH